jgi:hypothetical protein
MQTSGTALLAVERCSLVRVCMAAQGSEARMTATGCESASKTGPGKGCRRWWPEVASPGQDACHRAPGQRVFAAVVNLRRAMLWIWGRGRP